MDWKLFILLLLFTGTIALIVWLYRPGVNTKKYEEYGRIPLNNETIEEKKRDGRGNKKAKNK